MNDFSTGFMSGSNKSFIKNYEQYLDKIYNYIWYRVGFDSEISEDLCSEIFLKAYRKYESFDQSRSFQAWIYAIAKNHLLNHYRSRGREASLEEISEMHVDEISKLNKNLEINELIKQIYRLDEYSKEVLLLKYVDDFSNKEISELLNKDINAVRVQISRALEKLKRNIK